jgi:hypothetical protein
LTCLGLNSNPEGFGGSTLPSILCEELCLLVSWCVGDRCDMTGSNEDHDRSRRPGAEDRGWSSTGRVMLCVLCILLKEMRSVDFLVEPQIQGRQFVISLASKLIG